MFYCNSCKESNNYPESLSKSIGSCKLCGAYGVCNDVQSHMLPTPKEREKIDCFPLEACDKSFPCFGTVNCILINK